MWLTWVIVSCQERLTSTKRPDIICRMNRLQDVTLHSVAALAVSLALAACDGAGSGLPIPLATRIPPSLAAPAVTPTPTVPPTSTPIPAEILAAAERSLSNGDWDAAMETFEVIVASAATSPDESVRAYLGLALASLRRGDFGSARAALDALLAQFPDHPKAAQAYFLRGEAKLGLADWAGAITDYQTYLSLRPGLIDSFVYERIADANLALGQTEAALTAYDQAILAERDIVSHLQLREKVAAIFRSLRSTDLAIGQYQAILAVADNAPYRASIEFAIGQTYLEAGQVEAGYEQLTLVFMAYPESFEALSALRALLEAGYPVDQFQRGLVNYNQGQYDIALEAFYNYLASTPIDYPPDVHLFIARSYRQLGNVQAAISELQGMIRRFGLEDGEAWADAHLELADAYAAAGSIDLAFAAYDAFVAENPELAQAPDALSAAALLAESLGDTARMAAYGQRLATEYPTDARGARLLFQAALDSYRAGDMETAQTLLNTAAAQPANERPAASYYWLGRILQAAGNSEQAAVAFNSALTADGTRFYALRARDQINGTEPFAPPAGFLLPTDLDEGREEAEAWLVQTFALSEQPPLAESLRADLATDNRMLRGRELWELGQTAEARSQLEALRRDHQDDPLALYQLAIFYRDMGLYRSSLLAAGRVMQLADVTSLEAPPFLARLYYPTYFSDLVIADSERYGLDPLWVYALIWQESLFEGFAVSSASAQGLMQIWPPTGEDIAARLSWPGYQPSDLQRPVVSVAFGTWLLRDELDRFDQDPFAALTAYNAGPGSTASWVEASAGDPDLFVESISLSEPRTYVERIYEHYAMYRTLYGAP